jgi:hypothetical protein
MSQPAPAKAAPKTEAKPRQAFSAFGITVDPATAKTAGEKPPMTRERKLLIWLGALAPLIALGIWYQYGSHNELDSEAAANAGVREVVKLQEKKDTGALVQLSKSDDSAVARRAVMALADVGGPDAVRDALSDRRAEVRYAAVTGLGRDGDPAMLPLLAKSAQDPASDVRVAAIRGISNIRDFTIFEHLFPSLNDPDVSVRRSALGAIEDRIGLKFPDYKPEDSASQRGSAIARMRAQVAKMKQVFDRANEYEMARQQQQQKRR